MPGSPRSSSPSAGSWTLWERGVGKVADLRSWELSDERIKKKICDSWSMCRITNETSLQKSMTVVAERIRKWWDCFDTGNVIHGSNWIRVLRPGRTTSGHLDDSAPDTPHVGTTPSLVCLLLLDDLWRHPQRCPLDTTLRVAVLRVDSFRSAKISELDDAVVSDQHIRTLNITMGNILIVV